MTLTSDGNTEIATEPGKDYVFSAAGTFGSGTLTLQWSDGANWVTFQDSSGNIALTAAGGRLVTAPARKVRLALSGSSLPSITANFVARAQ